MQVTDKDVKQLELSYTAGRVLFQASDSTLIAGWFRLPFGPIKGTIKSALGLSDIKYFMSRAVYKMGLNPGDMEQPRAQSWLCAHQAPNCQLCPHASMDLISHQRAGRTSVSRRWTLLFSSTHGASSGHRGKLHQGMHTQSGTSI